MTERERVEANWGIMNTCENCQYRLVYASNKYRCYHDHEAKIDRYTFCDKHKPKETVNVKRIPLDSDRNSGVDHSSVKDLLVAHNLGIMPNTQEVQNDQWVSIGDLIDDKEWPVVNDQWEYINSEWYHKRCDVFTSSDFCITCGTITPSKPKPQIIEGMEYLISDNTIVGYN